MADHGRGGRHPHLRARRRQRGPAGRAWHLGRPDPRAAARGAAVASGDPMAGGKDQACRAARHCRADGDRRAFRHAADAKRRAFLADPLGSAACRQGHRDGPGQHRRDRRHTACPRRRRQADRPGPSDPCLLHPDGRASCDRRFHRFRHRGRDSWRKADGPPENRCRPAHRRHPGQAGHAHAVRASPAHRAGADGRGAGP